MILGATIGQGQIHFPNLVSLEYSRVDLREELSGLGFPFHRQFMYETFDKKNYILNKVHVSWSIQL